MFTHHHQIQFYETDLMGIMHHANYLRVFEEARVAWAHAHGMLDYQKPESASHLAVFETQVRHLKPGKFGDILDVQIQGRLEKIKTIFEYKMWRQKELLSECRTTHVSLDLQLKLIKPPVALKNALEKATWTETWLSSL